MIHPQSAADLQRLIDEIDSELRKLRELVRRGETLRAELAEALAALTAGNEP